LAARGETSDSIEFCRQMIRQSMSEIYPPPDREIALNALGLFHSRLDILMSHDSTRALAEDTLARYPFLAESGGRAPEVLTEKSQEEVRGYLKERFGAVFDEVTSEIKELMWARESSR
jgi:hypothetical protein